MIETFLREVQRITKADMEYGRDADYLFKCCTSEMGEWADATMVEKGQKSRDLKESSQQEAVDVVICALAMFYAGGGTDEQLASYGLHKLKKWAKRVPGYDPNSIPGD